MAGHTMLPGSQSAPSVALPNGSAMAHYTNRTAHIQHDSTDTIVLHGTPDQIVEGVLRTLSPKYQIDHTHQVDLCNTIAQAFTRLVSESGGGTRSRPFHVVASPPSPIAPVNKHNKVTRSSHRRTSAIDNHHYRVKNEVGGQPLGGNGPPKSVNVAFYHHHTDESFQRMHRDALPQYEKPPKPHSSGSSPSVSGDMSQSKALKRLNSPKPQKKTIKFATPLSITKSSCSLGSDASNPIEIDPSVKDEEDDSVVGFIDTVVDPAFTKFAPPGYKFDDSDDELDVLDTSVAVAQRPAKKKLGSGNVHVGHGSLMNQTQSFYVAEESDDENDDEIEVQKTAVVVAQRVTEKNDSDDVHVAPGSTENQAQSSYQAAKFDNGSSMIVENADDLSRLAAEQIHALDCAAAERRLNEAYGHAVSNDSFPVQHTPQDSFQPPVMMYSSTIISATHVSATYATHSWLQADHFDAESEGTAYGAGDNSQQDSIFSQAELPTDFIDPNLETQRTETVYSHPTEYLKQQNAGYDRPKMPLPKRRRASGFGHPISNYGQDPALAAMGPENVQAYSSYGADPYPTYVGYGAPPYQPYADWGACPQPYNGWEVPFHPDLYYGVGHLPSKRSRDEDEERDESSKHRKVTVEYDIEEIE